MCINCFSRYDKVPITEPIRQAADLVTELYDTDGGEVGGYGHVVFDDWNLDDVEWCLNAANENLYSTWIDENVRIASIKALQAFLPLSEDERAMALGIADGFIK